ncbi:MAG: InlB B-repeat-containing protein [Eubacteriales bacterium]
MKLKLSLVILAVIMVFALASCSIGGGTTSGDTTTTTEPPETTTTEPAASEYTVTFDTAGGDTVAPQTIAANQYATLPSPAPTKDGYTFAGWFNGATPYAFSATPVTANLTLTAHWTAIEYTVTYANAGDIEDGTYTIETGLELPVAVRRGYVLSAWLDDEDEEVTSIPEGTFGNITLTAEWEAAVPELEGYVLEEIRNYDLEDRTIHYAKMGTDVLAPNGLLQSYTAEGVSSYLYSKYDAVLGTMFNGGAEYVQEFMFFKTVGSQHMLEEDEFGDTYVHLWVDSHESYHPAVNATSWKNNEWWNISVQAYLNYHATPSANVYITWDMLLSSGSNAPIEIRVTNNHLASALRRGLLGVITPDGEYYIGEHDSVEGTEPVLSAYPFMLSTTKNTSYFDQNGDFEITLEDRQKTVIGEVPLDEWFNLGYKFVELMDGDTWLGYTVTIYLNGEELDTYDYLHTNIDFSLTHSVPIANACIHLFSGSPGHCSEYTEPDTSEGAPANARKLKEGVEHFTYGIYFDNLKMFALTAED